MCNIFRFFLRLPFFITKKITISAFIINYELGFTFTLPQQL
ncbi:hypothetical protein IQ02_02778 [Flavobacterium glaciei]|uniref:Uncharacterized protein n=1 Tax=Flavobacterium glaciei TaxID=386300 RepID=A0A562PHJ8_9FLAO|nr:hypothetical protein DFR66_11456 [Flavobacterium glaciei]TWI43952.1 hypothetical protein IQ02_02778 [Flavobacterium glaciei]